MVGWIPPKSHDWYCFCSVTLQFWFQVSGGSLVFWTQVYMYIKVLTQTGRHKLQMGMIIAVGYHVHIPTLFTCPIDNTKFFLLFPTIPHPCQSCFPHKLFIHSFISYICLPMCIWYIYIYMNIVYIMCIYIWTYIHTYITLHYITLHLHYITLHYITLHYITLHYITYIHTYIHTYIWTLCIQCISRPLTSSFSKRKNGGVFDEAWSSWSRWSHPWSRVYPLVN